MTSPPSIHLTKKSMNAQSTHPGVTFRPMPPKFTFSCGSGKDDAMFEFPSHVSLGSLAPWWLPWNEGEPVDPAFANLEQPMKKSIRKAAGPRIRHCGQCPARQRRRSISARKPRDFFVSKNRSEKHRRKPSTIFPDISCRLWGPKIAVVYERHPAPPREPLPKAKTQPKPYTCFS